MVSNNKIQSPKFNNMQPPSIMELSQVNSTSLSNQSSSEQPVKKQHHRKMYATKEEAV
jgi:hypothetical protein